MRRSSWIVVATALLMAVAAFLTINSRPPAFADPGSAAVSVFDDPDASILASKPWGLGRMVLVSASGELALIVTESTERGWVAKSRAGTEASTSDIQIGSLLVASGPRTERYPEWTAAFGEISDPAVNRVIVEFTDGSSATAPTQQSRYIVSIAGKRTAATLIAFNGDAEVARVNIQP